MSITDELINNNPDKYETIISDIGRPTSESNIAVKSLLSSRS